MRKAEIEFELKLGMAKDALKQFRGKRILRDIGIGKPETRKLRSTYFDTPCRSLRNAGYTLRIRRDGRKWLQTVKGVPADGEAGLARREIEVEVAEDCPDLDRLRPGRFLLLWLRSGR